MKESKSPPKPLANPETQRVRMDELPRHPAQTPQVNDDRGHSRGRVRMQASIDLRSDSNFFTGFSTNISEGGVFVATVSLLPLGSEVDLRFTLPSGHSIEVRGVVRWTREINDRTPDIFPGMGVQFQNLPPNAIYAIRDFVAKRDPLFFPD